MFVCPFQTNPKFLKTWVAFFLTLNVAFLNKIVKIKLSKYIVTVPKVYCVSTEGISVYPIHVSKPDCLMKLHDLYCISSTSRLKLKKKKKKKKIDLPPLPIFRTKGKQTFHFFRPYINLLHADQCWMQTTGQKIYIFFQKFSKFKLSLPYLNSAWKMH